MSLYLAASFVVLLLEVLCSLLFLEGFFKPRYVNIALRCTLLALVLFVFEVAILLIAGSSYMLATVLRIVVKLLIYTLMLAFLYDGVFLNKLILTAIWVFLLYMVNIFVMLLWGGEAALSLPLAERSITLNEFLLSLLDKIALLFIVLLVRLFTRRAEDKASALNNPRWLLFLLLPMLSILSISAMLNYYGTEGGGRTVIMLLCIGWLLLNIVAFQFLQRVDEREQRWQNSREMRRIASAEVRSLEALAQAKRRQRQLAHDFENHLLCLKNYMEDGEYEKAHEYVNKIAGSMQSEAEHAGTGHGVVDSILNQKIGLAAARGISLTTNISNLAGLPIHDDDMVAVLGNLLDNAIEACEKLPEGGRVIDVKLVQEEGSFILSVKNPVDKPVAIVDGRIATTKADTASHGIGLQSVQAALDKYDSAYAMRCEEGFFVFSAMVDF